MDIAETQNGSPSKLRNLVMTSAFRLVTMLEVREHDARSEFGHWSVLDFNQADTTIEEKIKNGLQNDNLRPTRKLTGAAEQRRAGSTKFEFQAHTYQEGDGRQKASLKTKAPRGNEKGIHSGEGHKTLTKFDHFRDGIVDSSQNESKDFGEVLSHCGLSVPQIRSPAPVYTKRANSDSSDSSDSSFNDTDSLFDDIINTDSNSSLSPSDSISNILPSVWTQSHPTSSESHLSHHDHPVTPFIRQHSPSKPISDPIKSSIPAITSQSRIVTCFRIAEVIRLLASTLIKDTLTIELYARVIESRRDQDIQIIEFADLFFPDRPPYLHGDYQAWNDCNLFDLDTKFLLRKPINDTAFHKDKKDALSSNNDRPICRAIIQANRQSLITTRLLSGLRKQDDQSDIATKCFENKQNCKGLTGLAKTTTKVEVLSIWETDWTDVAFVRDIIDPPADDLE